MSLDGNLRFAVLLCSHNGEPFLDEQLSSLMTQQKLPDLLFVHDWGSQDGSYALIERHRAAAERKGLACAWYTHRHDEAPGVTRSFLSALQTCLATSHEFDYLFFCDQDDVWHPQKLRRFAEVIEASPELDLVYCDVKLIDAQGQLLAAHYLGPRGAFGRPMDVHHPATLFVNSVSGMSMALSSRFLRRARAAWDLPDWFMHDWAMTIIASLTQAPVAFIPESLVAYRQHAGNLVGGVGRQRLSWAEVWRKARADVQRTRRQYQMCASLPPLLLGARPLPPEPGRIAVSLTILRGRSFRWLKTLKVAIGYALMW